MGWIIVSGIVSLLCIIGLINLIRTCNTGDVGNIFVLLIIITACAYVFILSINERIFDNNKKITYVKPEIQLVEKTVEHVKYMIDKDKIHKFTDMKWNDSNNIYWKIEHYKSKTNKTLVWGK
jgi:hypothetical protein